MFDGPLPAFFPGVRTRLIPALSRWRTCFGNFTLAFPTKIKVVVKPEPFEDERIVCDWCGSEGGEFYTCYDLGGEEYPYEKGLDLHDACRRMFVFEYGPRIWTVIDEVFAEVQKRHKKV